MNGCSTELVFPTLMMPNARNDRKMALVGRSLESIPVAIDSDRFVSFLSEGRNFTARLRLSVLCALSFAFRAAPTKFFLPAAAPSRLALGRTRSVEQLAAIAIAAVGLLSVVQP